MSIKIPKVQKPKLPPEAKKAIGKAIREAAFKPGSTHTLSVSGRTYIVASDGSWRRK